MADTIRQRSTLLTQLADNTTGLITPQVVRDVLVSSEGVYGQLYTHNGAGTQVVGTTPEPLEFASDGLEDGNRDDAASEVITIGTDCDGVYLALGQFSFGGTLSTTFEFHLGIDGVEQVAIACKRKLGTGGDVGSCSFCGLVTLAAAEDVSVIVEADGAAKDLDMEHGSLVLVRIA